MSYGVAKKTSPVAGTVAWISALVMFFPIAWMVLASANSLSERYPEKEHLRDASSSPSN